jgi:hypothetical protein
MSYETAKASTQPAKTSKRITNRRQNYNKQTSADMTIENKQ